MRESLSYVWQAESDSPITICTLDCPSIHNHSFHFWNTTCLCVFVFVSLSERRYHSNRIWITSRVALCVESSTAGGALPSCQHNNPTAETFPDVPPAELGCVSFDHRATTTCYVVSQLVVRGVLWPFEYFQIGGAALDGISLELHE